MIIGIVRETLATERRVAMIPAQVARLVKKQWLVIVTKDAGQAAGFSDADYLAVGAEVRPSNADVSQHADIIAAVNVHGDDLIRLSQEAKSGQVVIGMMDPLVNAQSLSNIAASGITTLALELIPRITRAQSMDVLSSMATVAGYKAVILAAHRAPRLFPMLMTAAGTLKPSRVFIMGVGVAGLQACATAKRLGGVVEAYDIRPAAREQILSVGAKPVELDLEAENTETAGGYAKEQSQEFIARQQQAMSKVLAAQDVVITTAAIPGRKAPVLITKAMVEAMKPGTVIVDLAAETGGNCELTQAGEEVLHHGVLILGPRNIASSAANHASQMYGTNLSNLLDLLINKDGELQLNREDEIIRDTLVTHQGALVNERLQGLLTPAGEQ
ncbi:Re/Si-specific NAD(P)(+) transhydrogenase subunit alpha [Shewanella sp. NIFS-20-20]|uniref:Re/Si-specific NAD(P)(+) transhydrogenase subunit alpha n=1 Tax=Shewanella sp. NIFS-20-20 TaxID=2853806 RepID=UPI001C46D340|nr:Re/Si-specific NAD(P)(+) transhydrogenase subunit alpha [Shewanella sp. NIFS-20-20]MBV7314670.1 Re/Si-specific NAD(P)(+) transhydrogenase subunit alpha [Shewanella sp. NIFS-20-20]